MWGRACRAAVAAARSVLTSTPRLGTLSDRSQDGTLTVSNIDYVTMRRETGIPVGDLFTVRSRRPAPSTRPLSIRPLSTTFAPRPVDLVIGADTVVEAGGRILEKPDDAAHAKLMLKS